MLPTFYDKDDNSPEAKRERRGRANAIKYALLFGLLILLFQPIYTIIMIGLSVFNNIFLTTFLISLILFWSWCIYKVWKFDFVRDEDKENES